MYATRKTYKNLALFDFDGTLYSGDSFTRFIFYTCSKRHILKNGLKILPWIQAYYLKLYPARSMRPKLFSAIFSQTNLDELQPIIQDYAKQLITGLNPELYQQLLQHQQQGDDVVLVSASVDIYLEAVCQLLEIDLICTQTEKIDRILTGKYITPDCSEIQKSLRIQQHYQLKDYQYIYAYGNSNEDMDMLKLADFPHMVGVNKQLPILSVHLKRGA
ncbi:HAD-IB family hydrolase [Acinetobacter rudis]|uniref:HAD hydrolase, family IB n=1 Tax=Acinetobacter rudis CIP 110305 TaxID=421052 RepID=S3NFV0_9GAMM|nr:HAD-IB family hydrolase [Acinetobacter rudis]EPF77388.1 HAD hydrolase, family IB [Acinetobacter rudis CIP 110305]